MVSPEDLESSAFRKSHKLPCNVQLAPLADIKVSVYHSSTEKCSHHRKPTQLDSADSNPDTFQMNPVVSVAPLPSAR